MKAKKFLKIIKKVCVDNNCAVGKCPMAYARKGEKYSSCLMMAAESVPCDWDIDAIITAVKRYKLDNLLELSPCPFCGSVATMRNDGIHEPVIDPATGAVVYARDEEAECCVIECSNCPAQMVVTKETGESEAELEQRAIKTWNRRDGDNDD